MVPQMGTVRLQGSRRSELIEVVGLGPSLVPWTPGFVLVRVSPRPPAHSSWRRVLGEERRAAACP